MEDLRGKNLSLQTQLKSLLDPTASALSCQNEEASQSANEASTSGPETPEEWSKKLKAANDIYEKVMDNVEKLKEVTNTFLQLSCGVTVSCWLNGSES